MLAGVGLELGAVDAHQAHAQQLQLLGQQQNLQEALRHRVEVLPPEARDRIVVGVPVRRNEANPDIAVRRPLDTTAGKDPVGVAVDQQRQHHPGVILRRARATMVHLEGTQIDAFDRLDHGVRQIIRRDPDVGLAGLALGVEAVEILLQPLLRGLPGVDGATDALAHSPKNLGPDQRAPVMTWAILESDR